MSQARPCVALFKKTLSQNTTQTSAYRKLVGLTARKMSVADVEDFIQQNRDVAERVETFRGYWESGKHWEARREFILRNMNDFENSQLDQLLSLSMVWSNNVFLGCRYNAELLEKVRGMAEGIVVEDAPVFKTRDEIIKNQQGR